MDVYVYKCVSVYCRAFRHHTLPMNHYLSLFLPTCTCEESNRVCVYIICVCVYIYTVHRTNVCTLCVCVCVCVCVCACMCVCVCVLTLAIGRGLSLPLLQCHITRVAVTKATTPSRQDDTQLCGHGVASNKMKCLHYRISCS